MDGTSSTAKNKPTFHGVLFDLIILLLAYNSELHRQEAHQAITEYVLALKKHQQVLNRIECGAQYTETLFVQVR